MSITKRMTNAELQSMLNRRERRGPQRNLKPPKKQSTLPGSLRALRVLCGLDDLDLRCGVAPLRVDSQLNLEHPPARGMRDLRA